MSDEELDHGFDHADHMGSEHWRMSEIRHIDSPWRGESTGYDPYYDRKSRHTSAVYLWWLVPFVFVVAFVTAVIGSIR